MSFCWCFSGKAGGKARAMSAGPFILNIGFAMAPRSSTSSRSLCFSPAASVSAMPSQKEAIMPPMTMLTTSFMCAPAPASPR